MRCRKHDPLRTQQGGNERVNPRNDTNRGLQEEARRLKQGAHRYRRQEALARRDRLRESETLGSSSRRSNLATNLSYLYSPSLVEGGFSEVSGVSEARTATQSGQGCLAAPGAR